VIVNRHFSSRRSRARIARTDVTCEQLYLAFEPESDGRRFRRFFRKDVSRISSIGIAKNNPHYVALDRPTIPALQTILADHQIEANEDDAYAGRGDG
jgi:hypothetical protein